MTSIESDSSPNELTQASITQLSLLLDSPDPARRMDAIRALGLRRGATVARMIDRCTRDANAQVRQIALETRAVVQENTLLFGPGELLRIEFPPAIRTLEEEERARRFIWVMWTVGGFIAITALLIREHTGHMALPLIGAFLATLAIMLVSMRLVRDSSRAGWVLIDLPQHQLVVEQLDSRGRIVRTLRPFDSLRGARFESRMAPVAPDESPVTLHELWLEFDDGASLLIARRESLEAITRVRERLKNYLPIPATQD